MPDQVAGPSRPAPEGGNARFTRQHRELFCVLAAGVLVGCWMFGEWTATSAAAFPHFALAALVLLYLPGRALLDWVRVDVTPPEGLTLALAFGTIGASAAYALSAALSARWLFWTVPAVSAAVYLWRRLRRPRTRFVPSRGLAGLAAVAVLAAATPAVVPVLYRNFDRVGGEMTYYPLGDVTFHLALSNALTLSIPPELPFLPGVSRHYHYGLDALIALFVDRAGLDALDVAVRFVPALLLVQLTLAAFCLARAWLDDGRWAILVVFLVLFGEDLSWLPGLFQPVRPWSVDFFGAPVLPAVFGLNPALPATAFVFVALLCLSRYSATGRRSWLVLSALMTASLVEYKVFAAAHLLLSLSWAALVHYLRFRERRGIAALAFAGALAVPVLLAMSGGPGPMQIALRPWPYVPAALVRMGLGETWLGRQALSAWTGPEPSLLAFVVFLGLAVPLYVVGCLGGRVLGLPRVWHYVFRPGRGDLTRSTAAAFVAIGPILALSLAITRATYPDTVNYNEAIWFMTQTKHLAWLLAADALRRIAGARWVRPLVAILLVLSSVPSTIEYLHYVWSHGQYQRLGSEELGLIGHLRRELPPGAGVMARPEIARAVLAMTRCRAPAPELFGSSFVLRPDLERHVAAVSEFWRDWRGARLRRDLLRRYRLSYIVVDRTVDRGRLANETDLLTSYDDGRYAVYALMAAE